MAGYVTRQCPENPANKQLTFKEKTRHLAAHPLPPARFLSPFFEAGVAEGDGELEAMPQHFSLVISS